MPIPMAAIPFRFSRIFVIAWPDLGCEAVRKLVVKDFPLTVLLDTHGGDLYQSGPAAYLASREHQA